MQLFLETITYYALLIVPWFIVGIVLSYFLDKHSIRSLFTKLSGPLTFKKIVLAQLFGMVSPLSVLSFLPMAKELTTYGIHPALLFSFFIAERAYDLQSFFIISTLFGFKFAVLNAAAIFISLLSTAVFSKRDAPIFTAQKQSGYNSFWIRQGKLLFIVIVGIIVGAAIRSFGPQDLSNNLSGNVAQSLLSGIISGFIIYLGPIVANYPVAKAFSEIGMEKAGVFAFLTVSPIFNAVVIMLFGSAVGFRNVIKPVLLYTACSILLTLLCMQFI